MKSDIPAYRKKDELKVLIGSLTQSEQRQFLEQFNDKRSKSQPLYIQLFKDLVNNEPIQRFGSGAQSLTIAKKWLYDNILRFLRGQPQSQERSELKITLQNVEVLYERNLLDQCSRLIYNARALAYKQEAFSTLLHIFKWESLLNALLDKPPRSVKEIAKETQEVIDIENNILALQKLFFQILEYKRIYGFAFGKGRQKIESDIMSNPLLHSIDNCHSQRARYYYHHIRSIYFFMIMDKDRAIEESSELVRMEPSLLPMHDYLNGILFHSTNCICSGYFLETLSCLQQAGHYLNQSPFGQLNILALKVFYYRANYEIECHIYTGELDAMAEKLKEVENSLKKYSERIPNEMTQVITVALRNGYMALGDEKKARHYLELMLQYDIRTTRNDIINDLFLFRLIWTVSSGLDAITPSLALSAHRHFSNEKNNDNNFELELEVSAFLKKEYDYKNKQKKQEVVEKLKAIILEHIRRIDPERQFVEVYSYYYVWLGSVATDQSFAESAKQWYDSFLKNRDQLHA